MSISSISSRMATELLEKTTLADLRLNLSSAISSQNFRWIKATLEILDNLPPKTYRQFMEEGAYYTALAKLMYSGRFQEIYNAFELMEKYDRLMTPLIRACKAVCLCQLEKLVELDQYFELANSEDIQSFISTAIGESRNNPHIKECYEELLLFYENLKSRLNY